MRESVKVVIIAHPLYEHVFSMLKQAPDHRIAGGGLQGKNGFPVLRPTFGADARMAALILSDGADAMQVVTVNQKGRSVV
jgi:hypothetical protein